MAESIRNLSNFNFQWTKTLYQIISMTWNNSKEKVLIIQEPEKTNFKSFNFHKIKITQFPDGLKVCTYKFRGVTGNDCSRRPGLRAHRSQGTHLMWIVWQLLRNTLFYTFKKGTRPDLHDTKTTVAGLRSAKASPWRRRLLFNSKNSTHSDFSYQVNSLNQNGKWKRLDWKVS